MCHLRRCGLEMQQFLKVKFMRLLKYVGLLPLCCGVALVSAQVSDAKPDMGVTHALVSRVEQDPAALSALRGYAKEGYREAQFPLAVLYHEGRAGLIKDGAEAAYWFRKAAEQGHAVSQFNLGVMLQNGHDVRKDEREAAHWYRQAAEQGDAHAQCALGVMLLMGQGLAKNPTEAALWFRKAAAQDHALAQYNLGQRYLDGQGIPKNDQEAVLWLRKAAEQGVPAAFSQLAQLYEVGQGVSTSPVLAYALYNLAAASGDEASAKRRDVLAKNMLRSTLDSAQALTQTLAVPKQFNTALDAYVKQVAL